VRQVGEPVGAGDGEQCCADGDEDVGADTGGMAANLAFQAKQEGRAGRRQDPERQVE